MIHLEPAAVCSPAVSGVCHGAVARVLRGVLCVQREAADAICNGSVWKMFTGPVEDHVGNARNRRRSVAIEQPPFKRHFPQNEGDESALNRACADFVSLCLALRFVTVYFVFLSVAQFPARLQMPELSRTLRPLSGTNAWTDNCSRPSHSRGRQKQWKMQPGGFENGVKSVQHRNCFDVMQVSFSHAGHHPVDCSLL